ncbi:MAG: tyrosine-type recombinase/integrase [Actinomycetia bacterium]|nr:tyrosine-type recombinase/integrase [Actinomycetes bacterium]
MASIRRHPRSNRWQVRYRDPGGHQRSKNFTRRVDAEKFKATVVADVVRNEWIDPQAGMTSFRVYAQRWMMLRGNLARSTRDRDQSYLNSLILPTFGALAVSSIKTSVVREWVFTLDKAVSTKQKALTILRGVLDLARDDDAIKVNPAADVKAPKHTASTAARPGRALTDAELEKVTTAAEAVRPDLAAMVWLMARCGLRVGEALAVRRDDIDFVAGTLRVDETLTPNEGAQPVKGRTRREDGRTIPMPPDATDRLRRHLDDQPTKHLEGWVFTGRTGQPVGYHNWRSRIWSRIVDEARIGDVKPHDLRHTCATRLFTVDRWLPAEVQMFLGHRSPITTLRIYTHVTQESLPEPSAIAWNH